MEEKPNHRFKLLRKALRKTQEALAAETGLSNSLVSKIESDTASLTEEAVDKLEAVYNFNRHWLVNGEGEIGDVSVKNITSNSGRWESEANNAYLQTKLNQAMSMIEKLIGSGANLGKSKAPGYYTGLMLENKNIGLSGAHA